VPGSIDIPPQPLLHVCHREDEPLHEDFTTMSAIHSRFSVVAVASSFVAILCGTACGEEYKVLDPGKSAHLVESAHFVVRWNDTDGVVLSDADLRKGLETLERIRAFYIGTVGFPEPYEGDPVKYKTSINLSNKGWATGSGTGKKDPAMWLHYNAFKDDHALAHEFAHCLQYSTMAMRDSSCVGWFWELGRYMIPDYRAPQRGGYNLVRIIPEGSGKTRTVHIRFEGLVQDKPGVKETKGEFENEPKSVPLPNSDWRWGLVAVDKDGKPRYSALQRGAKADLSFPLREHEQEVWLVVAATPTEMQQIFWDQMYYTIYRYPWAIEIEGGKPEVSHFPPVAELEKHNGKVHPNGGGWVAASAKVDRSAYVGPHARILGNAKVRGGARIEDYAVVRDTSVVSDEATVSGHALVAGDAKISGNARIEDEAAVYDGSVGEQARVGALTLVEGRNSRISGKADVRSVMNRVSEAELSGTVRLIGDIELNTRSLSKGVFYGMVNHDMVNNPRWGAERTEPAGEVTKSRAGN